MTATYKGERRSKGDKLFEVIGAFDAVQAVTGSVYEMMRAYKEKMVWEHWLKVGGVVVGMAVAMTMAVGGLGVNGLPIVIMLGFICARVTYALEKESNYKLGKISWLMGHLESIMQTIFKVSAYLADVNRTSVKFDGDIVNFTEEMIDQLEGAVPPLKNFILPVGTVIASKLHECRAAARLAERELVALVDKELTERTENTVCGLKEEIDRLSKLPDAQNDQAEMVETFKRREELKYGCKRFPKITQPLDQEEPIEQSSGFKVISLNNVSVDSDGIHVNNINADVNADVNKNTIDPNVAKFVNRLSDYFFACARYHVHVNGGRERIVSGRTD